MNTLLKGLVRVLVLHPGYLVILTLMSVQSAIGSDLEMTGFRLVQKSDSSQWEIQAETANYENDDTVLLGIVEAELLKKDGREISVIGASGQYLSRRLILTLRGNVKATTAAGYNLAAPTVVWYGEKALMVARGGVNVRNTGIDISGESLEYDTDSGITRVAGRVFTRWIVRSEINR
jgi:lipopolysaccharide assembly outer membrane protein LptD (OstA)